MTREAFEQSIGDWVASVTGLEVVYSDARMARRPLPYASVLILNDLELSAPEITNEYAAGPDTLTRTVRSYREGTVQVDIYGPDHSQSSRDLALSTWEPDVMTVNLAVGLTMATPTSGPTRLSRVTNGVVEDRSTTDYPFRYVDEASRETDFITSLLIDPPPTYDSP